MSQHEDEHGDGGSAPRRKPFDDDRDGAQATLETSKGSYHDAEIAALLAAGDLDAARQRLFARLRRAVDDAAAYEDVIRLEHAQGGSTWQSWVMRGLAACPDLAPRLLSILPEDALAECGVRQMLPWNALRGQRDPSAAHRLFALRVGALLWRGEVEQAFGAVVEPALLERAEQDAEARALIVAVLATFAWRDAARMRAAAPVLGVSLPEPDPERLPPYPLDALEHAVLLGEPMRRAGQRAACPPELTRAIELGPFFGGARARALLDELSSALRQRPEEALRFCDAAVETSSALAVYLADAIAELAHETAGAEAAPEDDRARRAIEGIARSERRRRGAAMLALGAGVVCGGAFAARDQLELAFALGAPLLLGAWALLGFLRGLSYVPRMRPALARAIVHGQQALPALRRTLQARPELSWAARRVERDEALALLGALAARPASLRP